MLKEGDKAPAFTLESDAGGTVSLEDFAGQTLVLYFYPRDNTPGCARQAQAFTSSRAEIETAGGAVVGVSRDSVASHERFRAKCSLGIALLSDPNLDVHKAYGAWGAKTMYGKTTEGVLRTTFLVRDGTIAGVFRNVKVDGHADAVLAALAALAGGSAAASSASKSAKKDDARPTRSAAKKTSRPASSRPASSKDE